MDLPTEEEGGSRKILHPITPLTVQAADAKGGKGAKAPPPKPAAKGKGETSRRCCIPLHVRQRPMILCALACGRQQEARETLCLQLSGHFA